jgi:MFS family permease
MDADSSASPSPPELFARRMAMTAVTVGTVVSAFEGTVVTGAMPTIARELGGLDAYAWVFSAFLIASMLALLVGGKLADVYGRLPVFVGGMGLFLAGSALCGAATSFGALVAFRVLQGLGAGALQPISMTIAGDLYRLEERARVQAFATAAWGAANVVGPVIGGWIVSHASWRWVFYVNVPIGAVAVAMLLASYRDPPRARRERLGARGALLAGGATALASFALAPDGLHAPAVRAAAVLVAVAASALLVLHEKRGVAPLLSPPLRREAAVQAGLVAGSLLGGILYGCAAYVPLWVTTQGRGNALAAGATLVPLLTGWALGSAFSVRLLVAFGMRRVMMGGFSVAIGGASTLAFVAATGLPTTWALAALAVLGLGLGPVASTSIIAPQSCVPWSHRAAVTSVMFASRMLGGSVAVAALGALGGEEAHAGTRFAGVALLAGAGVLAMPLVAPRTLRVDASDALGAAAE